MTTYTFRAIEGEGFMGQIVDWKEENRCGVTTRKCANCPVREATAMLARSAIGAETRFSRCLKAAVYRKALFPDRNQAIKRTFFTVERRPDAPRGVFHSLNRRNFTLKA
jgi:hypothetical protein